MADTITINDIHVDTLKVDVKLNINGIDYADTLPILKLDDAGTLTQQLQAFAQETRAEFQALSAAITAANANQPPTVDPAVTALVGQAIPVDVAPATPADGTTTPPADAGTTTAPAEAPATDGTTPTDAGTAPVDTTTTDTTPATGDTTQPATDGTIPTDGGTTTS